MFQVLLIISNAPSVLNVILYNAIVLVQYTARSVPKDATRRIRLHRTLRIQKTVIQPT